ncbi:MAG: hypothetical protein ACJAXX_003028 [Roseivirga sp.]|jgi:hypothetical protein
MRKYISIALLTIACLAVQAQSLSKADTEAINNRFKEFLSHTAKQDFDKVLGYLHPKQFEASSNIDMKQMTQLLKMLNIKLEINAIVGDLSGLTKQNDAKYALADYMLDMKLTLNEQNKAFADQILAGLKGQFGAGNIKYDAEKYLITAKGKKYVIWVKEKALGEEWYLVDFDPKSPNTWKAIVPVKVLSEASTKSK